MSTRTVTPSPDRVCAEAVEIARAAAVAEAGDLVGEHVGVETDGQRVATHLFVCHQPGYAGWRWGVTVARASRSKAVTVDDVVLLPGPDALLAPDWVPWSERLQAGDLGVGDLLPTAPDDERLAPAYLQSDDPAVEEVATELGLGRVRVMSLEGRLDAAERWQSGETGPRTAMAAHAPARCGTCGFYLQLAGSLRAAFGVCGNEYAPADGRVVMAGYGCGAHSEAVVESPPQATSEPTYDDATFDIESSDTDDSDFGHS
ncbi:MAG TPA: DUF3027 domain-containing protein [Mycobacteriales bacterium]|nr:DUF3027 domain-containing protein [Mycobacteriales bacterium]